MQTDDGAGAHGSTHGDGALAGVGAEEPAHQEVALQVVRLARVDDDAEQQPAREHLALVVVELVDHAAQALERGAARELVDEVALPGGHGELGPDRRCAL